MKILRPLVQCLRLNAPEWFERPEFLAILNSESAATWHVRGEPPNEMSDLFLTFDDYEGSDIFGVPSCEDIWIQIVAAAEAMGMTDGVVWISNVSNDD
jgi:hypothetical protein